MSAAGASRCFGTSGWFNRLRAGSPAQRSLSRASLASSSSKQIAPFTRIPLIEECRCGIDLQPVMTGRKAGRSKAERTGLG